MRCSGVMTSLLLLQVERGVCLHRCMVEVAPVVFGSRTTYLLFGLLSVEPN